MKRITSILLSLLMVFVLITPIVADDNPVDVEEAEPTTDEVVEETEEAVEETEEEEVEIEADEVAEELDLSADETLYIGNDTVNLLTVSVKRASSSSLKISWKKVSGATKYVVKRATTCDGTYSTIKTLTSSSTSYTNTGLKSYKEYWYVVYAYKGSTLVGASDRTPGYIMSSASSFKVTMIGIDDNEVCNELTWSVDNRVTSYRIQRKDNVNKTYQDVALIGDGKNSYTDYQVDLGRTYTYKIIPLKECVDDRNTPDDPGDDIIYYPNGVAKELTIKDLPHTPVFTVSKWGTTTNYIGFDVWSHDCREVTRVQIYRATSKTGTYKMVYDGDGSDNDFFDQSVKTGKTYYYKMRYIAKDSSGKDIYSKYSGVKSVKTGLKTPNIPIDNFSVSYDRYFTVLFDCVCDSDKYEVWVATSSTGTYKLLDTQVCQGYTFFSLEQTPYTTRYYKFRAYDAETKTYSAFTKPIAWCNVSAKAMAKKQILCWLQLISSSTEKESYYDNGVMDSLVNIYCTIFNKKYSDYVKSGLKNSKVNGGIAKRYKASVVDWVFKYVFNYSQGIVHKNYGKSIGYYSDGYYYLPEESYTIDETFEIGDIKSNIPYEYYTVSVKTYDGNGDLTANEIWYIEPHYYNGLPYWTSLGHYSVDE